MTNTEIKTEIIRRLRATGREGIEDTIAYLNESDFFSARCHRHHHYQGGLAKHSLEACNYALRHRREIPESSAVLASILHDICTAHHRNAHYIRGHGRRSVRILQEVCHLQLSQEECDAIRLHMHPEAAEMRTNRLARLVCRADKISAAGFVR